MKQFKRSFWQLLFFLTLTLSLITFVFPKRPKFQSSLEVTTARVWGYNTVDVTLDFPAFKNDVVTKGVFAILNKLFSDKKNAVSLFIHQFLLNKTNLAKSRFQKNFSYINSYNKKTEERIIISTSTRTVGLWSTEGERVLMTPNFQLSSLGDAQKGQNWLAWLKKLVRYTAVFDSDYTVGDQKKGPFNLEETRKNIRNLFVGLAIEEMKIQLKDNQGLFVESLDVLWEEMKVQLKGEQGNKGVQGVQGLGTPGNQGEQGLRGTQGLGTQGAQGSRGPAGQNGQIKKEVIIGLSIGLGVVFCLFLAYVIYQKRVFSAFKNPKKSTKI